MVGMPAEHDDLMTLAVKCAGEDGADLSGSPGNDDLHNALPGRICACGRTMF